MTTTTDVIEHLARIAENDYSLPDVASDIRDLATLRQQRDELLAAAKAAEGIAEQAYTNDRGAKQHKAEFVLKLLRAAIAKCEG